jgi:hypothetical protein
MMSNQNFQNTLRLGFWRATTIVIIITIFSIIFIGAFTSGGLIGNLWFLVGLAIIPGTCVGILQAFMLEHASVSVQVKWFGIAVVSTAIGWCAVFALMAALLAKIHSLPEIISGQFLSAAFDGLITGALIGAIVGSVSGLIQAYIQHLPTRQWISSNVISWSVGVAIPLVAFYVLLSLMNFFFVF